MPVAHAQLGRGMTALVIRELSEQQRFPERRRDVAVEVFRPDRVQRIERAGGGRRDVHDVRAVLIIPLVRPEEEQFVSNQRSSHAPTEQVAGVVRLLDVRVLRHFCDRDRVERHEVFVLIRDEGVTGPDASARLRRGRDDCARGVLVFCLEILCDDAVLLNRIARERVAAAGILTRHAARAIAGEIVLETRAVDEDVDFGRSLGAGCKRSRRDVVGAEVHEVGAHCNAGCQRCKVEKVAARRGQVLDLLRRHVGGDL